MSSSLMMSDMHGSGGQTVIAMDAQAIRLNFYWGKSCFKGKYPRWRQIMVSDLLHNNGLTDEMLSHELKLINDQVNTYYGSCMRCYVLLYIVILLCSLASIGAQFAFPSYRANVLNIVRHQSLGAINSVVDDFVLKFIFILGGIIGIFVFLILMLIHRKCFSKIKYKKTMMELKDYIYGFELQNKYQLVKWVVKHTIDGVQFDIIVTPLQREAQLLKRPVAAMSTVSI